MKGKWLIVDGLTETEEQEQRRRCKMKGKLIVGGLMVSLGLLIGIACGGGGTADSATKQDSSPNVGVTPAKVASLDKSSGTGPTSAENDTQPGGSGEVSDGGKTEPAPEPTKSTSDSDSKPRRGAPARVLSLVADNGSGPVSVRITIEPSPDLPDRPTEASGVFVRRQDNSIFVGTGVMELNVEFDQVAGGSVEPKVSLSTNGPVIEAVVTHDTIIYREETEMPSPSKSGEVTVQQVVRPVDSLDELGKNTELQVWGRRSGDRVVADVLVYRIVTVDLPF